MFLKSAIAVVGCGMLASSALAGDYSLQLTQTLYTYSSGEETSKASTPGAKEVTTTSSGFHSTPSDLEVLVGIKDKFYIYFYPTADTTIDNTSVAYDAVAFSYLMKNIEFGLNIGYGSDETVEEDKNADTKTTTTVGMQNIGLFGTYYLGLGKSTLEITLVLGTEQASYDQKDKNAKLAKWSSSMMSYGLGVYYVLPLAKGFSYVAGFGYSMATGEKDVTDVATGTKTSTDMDSSEFTLSPLRVRFNF